MAHARARTFSARGPRRKTTWVGPANQGYISVATGASTILGSFTPSTDVVSMAQPTVIRVRGAVSVIGETFAADLEYGGAFGMAVVSTQAFNAGIAAVPTPFTEAGWNGWFVWRSFANRLEFGDATGRFLAGETMEIDSKAMRKVGTSETVILVAESQVGAIQVASHVRMLVKLS